MRQNQGEQQSHNTSVDNQKCAKGKMNDQSISTVPMLFRAFNNGIDAKRKHKYGNVTNQNIDWMPGSQIFKFI